MPELWQLTSVVWNLPVPSHGRCSPSSSLWCRRMSSGHECRGTLERSGIPPCTGIRHASARPFRQPSGPSPSSTISPRQCPVREVPSCQKLRPRSKPDIESSTTSSVTSAGGSSDVLATTVARSTLRPLVMNVLGPFRTEQSASGLASLLSQRGLKRSLARS
jgi:hypothetical protein